jgi:hypothetical protein
MMIGIINYKVHKFLYYKVQNRLKIVLEPAKGLKRFTYTTKKLSTLIHSGIFFILRNCSNEREIFFTPLQAPV